MEGASHKERKLKIDVVIVMVLFRQGPQRAELKRGAKAKMLEAAEDKMSIGMT